MYCIFKNIMYLYGVEFLKQFVLIIANEKNFISVFGILFNKIDENESYAALAFIKIDAAPKNFELAGV